jgi:hypothetical protein
LRSATVFLLLMERLAARPALSIAFWHIASTSRWGKGTIMGAGAIRAKCRIGVRVVLWIERNCSRCDARFAFERKEQHALVRHSPSPRPCLRRYMTKHIFCQCLVHLCSRTQWPYTSNRGQRFTSATNFRHLAALFPATTRTNTPNPVLETPR